MTSPTPRARSQAPGLAPAAAIVLALLPAATVVPGCKSEPAPRPLGSFDAGSPPAMDASAPDAAQSSGGDASADGAESTFLCPPDRTWTTLASQSWLTGVRRFGGITPDELKVAWVSDTGAISFATRAKRSEAFATPPTIIPTESTPVADDRIALGPDGTTIVAVSADRSAFVAFGLQGSTWGPLPATQFVNVAQMGIDTQAQFFEPVLGADGLSFYYVLVPAAPVAGLPALYRSAWDPQQHVWAAGVLLTNPAFASPDATHRRRATGASFDGLTLFFFDEETATERAAWRSSLTDDYTQFRDLSGFAEAAPTGHCDRLYFQQGSGATGAIASGQ